MNKFANIYLAAAVVAVYVIYVLSSQWPDNDIHLIFCDVGQGDAILVTDGFWQMLIDGGPDAQVLECLGEYMPLWDRRIELVIATHPDSDHIDGLRHVLQRFEVSEVMIQAIGKDTVDFKVFRSSLMEKLKNGTKLSFPKAGSRRRINTRINIKNLSPRSKNADSLIWESSLTETELSALLSGQEERISNYNDLSIAVILQVGRIRVLLSGDLEKAGEGAVLSSGLITDVDILKAGHHGSKSSSSGGFLEESKPENIVVSSGKNNKFGHPHPEVLQKFVEIGAEVWRTDELGSIEIVIDGQRYWF